MRALRAGARGWGLEGAHCVQFEVLSSEFKGVVVGGWWLMVENGDASRLINRMARSAFLHFSFLISHSSFPAGSAFAFFPNRETTDDAPYDRTGRNR